MMISRIWKRKKTVLAVRHAPSDQVQDVGGNLAWQRRVAAMASFYIISNAWRVRWGTT